MKWRLDEDTVMRTIDDQAVLLQLVSGRYYGLDEIGADMLQTIFAAPSFDAAISELLARYDTTADVLRRDATELLQQLEAARLVERAEGGPAQ